MIPERKRITRFEFIHNKPVLLQSACTCTLGWFKYQEMVLGKQICIHSKVSSTSSEKKLNVKIGCILTI